MTSPVLNPTDSALRAPRSSLWEGILVVNKPQGPTSNQVLQRLKQASGRQKMGYQGTLDPLATGVLPVCVGWATKLIPFLPSGPKRYRAQLILGIRTDTQDALGKVLATSDHPLPDRTALEEVCRSFIGLQPQTPPVYSALKFKGKPLYRWARQGKPVVKPPRIISIDSIRVTALNGKTVSFEVTCSAGTYIRSLGADIGERLGCGATLKALERIQSGSFTMGQARSPEDLVAAAACGDLESLKIPLPEVFGGWRRVRLAETWKKKIKEGCLIPEETSRSVGPPAFPGEPICITGEGDELWAFYQAGGDVSRELKPLRVLI